MTGRKRIEAALSPGGTRDVPAVICYEGICIRDHWDELTACPWWYRLSGDLDHQFAWRRDAIAGIGQDWFALPTCEPRCVREATAIEPRPEGVFRVDRATGRRTRLTRPLVGGWDPRGVSREVDPSDLPTTPRQVDQAIPLPDEFDAAAFACSGRGDLAARMLDEFGRDLLPLAGVSSPLWACYGHWGFTGLMTLIADRPGLVARACERLLAGAVRSVAGAAAIGAAAIWIEECMTDMISPAAYAALNVPILRRLIDAIRAAGMKSIYYYCGDPADRWDHILSLGMDALSLEEAKKGFRIDVVDVAARAAGTCAVLGDLDAIGVLDRGSDDELRTEIARQLAAGRRNGGRFIMSIGSPVTPATPMRRVRLYCRLVRELSGQGQP